MSNDGQQRDARSTASRLRSTSTSAMHLGRVIGKFRLDRRLGSGAMGDVFLGVHVELGSFVAVKILNAAACAEPNGVARFLNEARAVAAIDHEQIARVFDQDKLPDGTPYIVMEYVEGTTLRELLEERRTLGLRLTLDLTLDILSALSVAHARGIVHRDLKPENVRVTKGGRAKILDFGIAKLLHAVPTPLTQQGMLVGTPYYMSPEQIDGRALDGRADLYALGVMLFECVTGQRPFEGSTVVALLHRHLQEAPPSLIALRPDVPRALERHVFRALEKQAALRFATAEEFAEALRGVREQLPSDGPVVRRPSREHPVATPSWSTPQGTTEDALGNTVATPLTRGQGTTEDALGQTVPTPLTRAPGTTDQALGAAVTAPHTRRGAVLFFVAALLVLAGGGVGLALRAHSKDAPAPVADLQPLAEPPAVPTVELAPPTPSPVVQQSPAPNPPSRAKATRLPSKTPAPAAPLVVAAVTVEPPVEPKPSSGVTLIETGKDRRSLPIDFDPKAFEPLAFLAKAQAIARARMPDAVLVDFSVEGLFSGDRVDLTLSREFGADYFFRSPALSVADSRLREEDQDIPCLFYVVVSAIKIETYTTDSFSGCKERALPRIGCSVSSAMMSGEVSTARALKASWLADGWYFDFGANAGSRSVKCP